MQVVREAVPPVGRWVSAHRTFMSLANNGSLIVIVWIQLCSAHDKCGALRMCTRENRVNCTPVIV